jgi:trehalose 6-phosphate phosphatase
MTHMLAQPTTPDGVEALDVLLDDPSHALLAFDYDGTLAPIVSDPTAAVPQPGAVDALKELSAVAGSVVIITGRPAATAATLGGFDIEGLEKLTIVGQYGAERWDGRSREVSEPPEPPGLADVRTRLPRLIEASEIDGVEVEDKGIAVAVHVRNADDPERAQLTLLPPLSALAEVTDLHVEPGRYVIELRAPGTDKGRVVRELAEERHADVVVVFGDDLGDIAAFDAVEKLRAEGVYGLIVCSASDEVPELIERADLVVDGPHGVIDLIHDLVSAIKN